MKAAKKVRPKTAPPRTGVPKTTLNDLRATLSSLVAGGGVRLVDLTQTLSPDFPPIVLPPDMGQSRPFRMEEISRYDDRGPAWYWNNVSFGEHTGTHFDAPIHWISGRDLPNNSTDTLPVEHFIAPACVIDCSDAGEGRCRFPSHRYACQSLGEATRPRSSRLMGLDADRLVEARRSGRLSKSRRYRSAHAGSRSRMRPLSGERARRARLRHRDDRHRCRPSGTPLAAVSRAITTCTAPANTGCNVCAISIACRRPVRSLSPHR